MPSDYSRVEEMNEEFWPGPIWTPNIWDGSYPVSAVPGDIYVNRFTDPPLFYLFTSADNCKMIDRKEIEEWISAGLMKLAGPDPTKSR